MSNSTTSPSSFRPIRWASVPPIWPAPINAILGRAMRGRNLRSGRRKPAEIGHRPFPACHSSRSPDCASVNANESEIASCLHQAFDRSRGDCMASPVRRSEISLRAHLDQPGGGALELARLKTFVRTIKRARFSFRRSNELHRVVVERIDQDDETLGLVAPVVIHDRYAIEHNRMVLTRDLEIVGGGE